jgi:hypothetical protein
VNLSIPRLVVLDTATINYVADKPNDPCSKELIGILSIGDWIPFLTSNVLQEIACYENDAVFQRRHIASFAPYVDLINVDKRVAEMFRQLSGENQSFSEIYKRVPEKRGLPGLIEALKKN